MFLLRSDIQVIANGRFDNRRTGNLTER